MTLDRSSGGSVGSSHDGVLHGCSSGDHDGGDGAPCHALSMVLGHSLGSSDGSSLDFLLHSYSSGGGNGGNSVPRHSPSSITLDRSLGGSDGS